MVQKELKKRNKSRSLDQIKAAIQIMSQCIIMISKGKKEIWKGAILQDLVTVDREEYIEDTGALHAARLPLFISHAIDKLEYRQFNIDRHMQLKTQLSRWLYKRFVHRYKQASMIDTYHFMYSTVKAESRYLEGKTERNNRKKMLDALEELKGQGVLMSYEVRETKEGRKIIDVKYTVTASHDFRTEQKAANAAAKNRQLGLVDK
ncbi:[weak similarity to] replication protein RepA [methanotrophic bacterial endosymbiont of Bathymodiolus sp.]|nr:[weak similarity to] replication protein RepA [methanotrophic bacterial endosymbiont of Bathymodiolus sp.]